MTRRVLPAGFALSALALSISPALATDIRFDGFASFVGGQVLDKDELLNPLTGEYQSFQGFDERFSFQSNSLFALQARADLKEKLSATAQIIAKGSDDYDARFNWAYLSYEINNEWTAKLGRQRLPYFMYSDFLDVGYAYHWISPPDSVYNLGGFDSGDGISLEYQTNFGSWTSRLTMLGGRADADISTSEVPNARAEVENIWLLAWSMNYDWLTLRVVHSESDLSISSDLTETLALGLQAFGVTEDAIAGFQLESDPAIFDGVAIAIDTGQFFAVGEYTELQLTDSFGQDPGTRWYVSGGVRFGDFTVYATTEKYTADPNSRAENEILGQLLVNNGLPSGNPADLYTQVFGGTYVAFEQTKQDENTNSIGVRYNFHPSASFKIEYMEQDDKVNDLKPAVVAMAVDLVY